MTPSDLEARYMASSYPIPMTRTCIYEPNPVCIGLAGR